MSAMVAAADLPVAPLSFDKPSPAIFKAISSVSGELAKAGIGKDKKNEQQGYRFRGIDDVYNALAPALVQHGLVVLPRVLSREVTERETRNGGVLFYVVVNVEFDLIAVADGSRHTIRTYGEAMDSGDKATNKALSAAYKYAMFQTFCVPTEGTAEDADAQTHEPAAKTPAAAQPVPPVATAAPTASRPAPEPTLGKRHAGAVDMGGVAVLTKVTEEYGNYGTYLVTFDNGTTLKTKKAPIIADAQQKIGARVIYKIDANYPNFIASLHAAPKPQPVTTVEPLTLADVPF